MIRPFAIKYVSAVANVIPSDWLELTGDMVASGNNLTGNDKGRSRLYIEAGTVGWIKAQGDLAMILEKGY